MTLMQKKGSALTKLVDDSRVAAFLAKGYELLEPRKETPTAEKPLEKMTVEELRGYAEAHGITLPDDGKKADLVAAIANAGKGGGGDGDENG